MFESKNEGTFRFCTDNCKLNTVTIRYSYPIPRKDQCVDSLSNATIFSALDANSGYWKMEIAEQDRDKTAYASHHRLFQFTWMPFGQKNAPETF